MGRTKGHIRNAVLVGAGIAAASSFSIATAQIGGFDTEMPKPEKRERTVKEDIVYVNQQAGHPGPKTIEDALKLVKDNGEIIVHPGEYRMQPVSLTKNVTIRGLDDDYGSAPTFIAPNGCVSVKRESVSARISNLTFHTPTDSTCISVGNGRLHLANTEVLGRHAGRRNLAGASHVYTDEGVFIPDMATNVSSALVSITGGDVTISGSRISGGTTGIFIDPKLSRSSYQHVEVERTQVTDMERAGVVMVGAVDATLTNNHIINNGMSGVVFSGSGYARFVGNTISNNRFNGLYLEAASEAVSVERNMIHDNSHNGIQVGSGTAVLVANEIGEHRGCRVREEQVAQHTNIRLYENGQGTSLFQNAAACRGDEQAEKKRRRRNRHG